jgi:integrase
VIQERLGHASFNITMSLYAHVVPGMQTEAANSFDDMVVNGQGIGDHLVTIQGK